MATKPIVPVADLGQEHGDVISPQQLAEILSLSIKTIYAWIAAGRLAGCSRKRGKHILIGRVCALERIFAGPDW